MQFRSTFVALTVAMMTTMPAWAAEKPAEGGGDPGAASDAKAAPTGFTPSVKFNGRLYTEFGVQTTDTGRLKATGGNGFTEFEVRRVFLLVDGKATENIGTYFEIEAGKRLDDLKVTGSDASTTPGRLGFYVRSAYMEFSKLWEPNARIRVGQQATPWTQWENQFYGFRMQNQAFSAQANFFQPRDLGAAIRGDLPMGWGDYDAGVFNGEGFLLPEANGGKNVMARVALTPFKPFGFAALAPITVGGMGMIATEKDAYAAIAAYGKEGQTPWNIAFTAYGTNDKTKVNSTAGMSAFGAFQLGTIHPVLQPFTLMARANYLDPSTQTAGDASTTIISGVSWNFAPRTRILFDDEYTMFESASKGPQNMVFAHFAIDF